MEHASVIGHPRDRALELFQIGQQKFFWDHFLEELRNQASIGSRAFSSQFEPVMDDGECSAVPQKKIKLFVGE